MNTKHGEAFDLQKSISGLPGFPWAKYKGEYHLTPAYNYLGPGTALSSRLDDNMQPKPGEEPIDRTDNAALGHDIRYTLAEQQASGDNEVIDLKHEADRIMLEELSKVDPSCFRERFAKWIAEQALRLKLKLGMKLDSKTGKPIDPLYSDAHANFWVDLAMLQAKREYQSDPSSYPDNYLEEMRKTTQNVKRIIAGSNLVFEDAPEVEDKEATDLVNQYLSDLDKDAKEYTDYKAEQARKAREVSFIDRLVEIIEKPMKYFTDYTFGQIPVVKDYLTYDKLKGAIGVKSKWEYREEAEQIDEAIKTLDENIRVMKKQNNNSQSSQLDELYTKVSALRDARRDYAKVLGYGLPVLKSIRAKLAAELHSPIVHKFTRRSVFINALDDTWSADIIFLPNKDEGYKGILTVIDCFSKYGWAIPVKSKTNKELVEAFKTIFQTSRKPKRLWTDKGTEFYGADFRAFLNRNKIKLYSTESELKAVIIERWNRTLKEKMYRKFTELTTADAATDAATGGKQQWLHLIPTIVDEYNNTTHSAHKMTPVEASKPENESIVKQRLHAKMKKYTSKPPKFAVGNKVRIYSYKYTFDKGYKKNYTDEVFEVSAVHPTVPWTYSISDSSGEQIQGKFYNEEMIHSEFDFDNRLQKNKVYVLG